MFDLKRVLNRKEVPKTDLVILTCPFPLCPALGLLTQYATHRANGDHFVDPTESLPVRVVHEESIQQHSQTLPVFGYLSSSRCMLNPLLVIVESDIEALKELNFCFPGPGIRISSPMLKVGNDGWRCDVHEVMQNHQDVPVRRQRAVVRRVDLPRLGPSFDKDTHFSNSWVTLAIASKERRVIDSNMVGEIDVTVDANIVLVFQLRIAVHRRRREGDVCRRESEFGEYFACSS